MQPKLHFSRFEFKYILPAHLRQKLESELQYFVELDPYVANQPKQKYFVRSLYFDNQWFTNYHEKIDGLKHRAKFRLRTYTNNSTEECPKFLEIKGRHSNLVFKHRTELDDYNDDIGTNGDYYYHPTTNNILQALQEGAIKTKFVYELHRKSIEPMVLVDYWRRPYVSRFDPEFRITFDDTLCGTVAKQLFPSGRGVQSVACLPGYTIVEVKFRYHIPKWFHRLIQSLELRRVSISKFCAAIEANKITEKLD